MSYLLKSIGSNGNYQLGLEDDEDHDQWQDVISFNHRPVLSCGGNHTILLVEGKIFGCGQNTSGQCGIDSSGKHVVKFQQISIARGDWTIIATGWSFSLFVNESNELWCCGEGLNGELGLGKDIKVSSCSKITQFDSKIIKISTSLDHALLQLENGEIYGWGNNKKQQLLKHDDLKTNKIVWQPTKLDFVKRVKQFTVGRDFSLLQFDDNSFTYIGKDKFNIAGQLEIIEKDKIQELKSMWSSIHLLVDGQVISIGNNSHGQLLSNQDLHIDKYAIGSEHGLIASNNKLYSWGWGEHGNCGIHHDGKSRQECVTFDYLNEIYEAKNLIDIYCGCATSWIVCLDE